MRRHRKTLTYLPNTYLLTFVTCDIKYQSINKSIFGGGRLGRARAGVTQVQPGGRGVRGRRRRRHDVVAGRGLLWTPPAASHHERTSRPPHRHLPHQSALHRRRLPRPIQLRHRSVFPTRLNNAVVDIGWLGSVLDSGEEGPGFISQPRRRRVTVLGKLFTPIVPLFTKQRNW